MNKIDKHGICLILGRGWCLYRSQICASFSSYFALRTSQWFDKIGFNSDQKRFSLNNSYLSDFGMKMIVHNCVASTGSTGSARKAIW